LKYDLIIVAASKDDALRKMTQEAIDSCLMDRADVNVILVETFKKYTYRNVNTEIFFEGEFNYNHCLNLGLKHRKGDVQILANNDIIFQRGWSSIGETMKTYGYLSASALSNHPRQKAFQRGDFAYEGYEICLYVTGWCLFVDKNVWDKIGALDESYRFWYSDNVYIEQLKRAHIKHFLICNVLVLHYISRTLAKQDRKTKIELTNAERKNIQNRNRTHLQKKL
jgi:hypothetical protein